MPKKTTPAKRTAPTQTGNGFADKIRSSKASVSTPANDTVVQQALSPQGRLRLLFRIDATASRRPSWDLARTITAVMFDSLPDQLDVALTWHASSMLQEITPFASDATRFAEAVRAMHTQAGATRLNAILQEAIGISPHIRALVYAGDCYEEEVEIAYAQARKLKLLGVKCFFFHDTLSDPNSPYVRQAREVFEKIVAITGGMVLSFAPDTPEQMKDPLEAIATYAAGGLKLLEQRQKALPAAKTVLKALEG